MRLDRPDKNGVTARQHLESAWRQTGVQPAILEEETQMPALLEYLWSWFLRMSRRRGGGFGPAPLSHETMQAFFAMNGITPTPWEIERIEELDDLYLQIQGEEERKKASKKKKADKAES